MSPAGTRSFGLRLAEVVSTCTAVVTSSLWIAICAAAPEFIWQGLRIVFDHLSWTDLASVLMIGLILAFFVEPLMERMRGMLHRPPHQESSHGAPYNAMFTAVLSLAFALISVCVHDAISAFVSGRSDGHTSADTGLAEAIMLVAAWAFVPFAVTLAWLSVRCRWTAVPMGVIGGASPCIAGWLFSWSAQTVITTIIPYLVLLAAGYRQITKERGQYAFVRCSQSVALVATIWLVIAWLFDTFLAFDHLERLQLHNGVRFWMDVRFYLGWTLGLVLAPFPFNNKLHPTMTRSC